MARDRQRLNSKRDRFRQLRAFCHAARLRSISQAAQYLDMTPAAVSIQVRELEYELEAAVFERTGSRISLTVAGETFYGLAMPLVQGVEGLAENFIERIDDDISGRLDVAASVAGATIVLPPYVKRLRDLYPRVRLWVRNCPLDEGLKLLLADEVEFVLGGQHSSAPEAVEYREILSYDIVLITSLDHALAGREAVTPEDAAKWPAIVPPTGTSSLRFGNAMARQFGVDINALMEVGGWGVIKRYVERGFGVSVVPSICLHETDRLSVIPLKEYFATQSYGAFTRRGKFLTPLARRLLDLMMPECQGSSSFPQLCSLKSPHPQVMSERSPVRTSPDFSLSLSR